MNAEEQIMVTLTQDAIRIWYGTTGVRPVSVGVGKHTIKQPEARIRLPIAKSFAAIATPEPVHMADHRKDP